MDSKPVREEQGKLTYNLLNEQSVAAGPAPLQATSLQTPLTWAQVLEKKAAHEKRLANVYESKKRLIDGANLSDSEDEVLARRTLAASAAGLQSSQAAAGREPGDT